MSAVLPFSRRIVTVSRIPVGWCVETIDRATGENEFSAPFATEAAAWIAAEATARRAGWVLADHREGR